MVFLTCSVSLRSISCRYFSKWWLKIFSGVNPPYPRTLTAYPTPVLVPPEFFHQNDWKECKPDYLDAWGHYVLHFGAIGDKLLRRVAHPLGRQGLRLNCSLTLPYNVEKCKYVLHVFKVSQHWMMGVGQWKSLFKAPAFFYNTHYCTYWSTLKTHTRFH